MITQERLDSNFFKRNFYLEYLKGVPLFSNQGEKELGELAKRMVLKRWHGGAIIVGQNEPGDAFYLLVSGQVKVVLFGENGREMTLSLLESGDFFGEMALLSGKPRSANILALTDVVILMAEREDFLAHLGRCPQTAILLMKIMADRLHRADELITNLALHDVSSRLTRTLISMAEEKGEVQEEGIFLRQRPTQQDLANMVGTCRETVSRALSSLARRGLVVSRGRSLLLRRALVEGRQQAA